MPGTCFPRSFLTSFANAATCTGSTLSERKSLQPSLAPRLVFLVLAFFHSTRALRSRAASESLRHSIRLRTEGTPAKNFSGRDRSAAKLRALRFSNSSFPELAAPYISWKSFATSSEKPCLTNTGIIALIGGLITRISRPIISAKICPMSSGLYSCGPARLRMRRRCAGSSRLTAANRPTSAVAIIVSLCCGEWERGEHTIRFCRAQHRRPILDKRSWAQDGQVPRHLPERFFSHVVHQDQPSTARQVPARRRHQHHVLDSARVHRFGQSGNQPLSVFHVILDLIIWRDQQVRALGPREDVAHFCRIFEARDRHLRALGVPRLGLFRRAQDYRHLFAPRQQRLRCHPPGMSRRARYSRTFIPPVDPKRCTHLTANPLTIRNAN